MRIAWLLAASLVTSVPALAFAQQEWSTDAVGSAEAPVAQPAPAASTPPSAPPDAQSAAPAPLAPPATKPAKPFHFGFWAALPFGEHFPTALTPGDASYQVDAPDTSWALGIVGEYRIAPALRVFLDGGRYTESVQVAKAGQPSGSFWVYEQTGYTTHTMAPFDKNVRYYMDTTALRLGASYVIPFGSLEAWGGATVGVYAWQATYGTDNRSSKWGQTSGTATGFTLIAGIDAPLSEFGSIGLFFDFASPVADGQIKDLFKTGWTWTVSQHVMGPYRFGVRMLF